MAYQTSLHIGDRSQMIDSAAATAQTSAVAARRIHTLAPERVRATGVAGAVAAAGVGTVDEPAGTAGLCSAGPGRSASMMRLNTSVTESLDAGSPSSPGASRPRAPSSVSMTESRPSGFEEPGRWLVDECALELVANR